MNKFITKLILFQLILTGGNAITIGETLVLDTVYDEHVSSNGDPRLSGIIISARTHKNSTITISYNGDNGYYLTKNLIKSFDRHQIPYSVVMQKKQTQNKVIIELRQDD